MAWLERTIAGRDGFVFDGIAPDGAKNTNSTTAEEYWSKVGGRNTPAGEIFHLFFFQYQVEGISVEL